MTEIELCKMCGEYCSDVECEHKDECKLLEVVKENKRLHEENEMLKKEIDDLKLKMSYMVDPNAIGRNWEMGW